MYACDTDLADDDLEKIIRLKQDMIHWLDDCHSSLEFSNSKDKFKEWDKCIEEQFDELFYKQWKCNRDASGSVEWTTYIPSCEVLRAQIAKEKRDKEASRMAAKELRFHSNTEAHKIIKEGF